jgi:hypothetical protein
MNWASMAEEQWLTNARAGLWDIRGKLSDDLCLLLCGIMAHWRHTQEYPQYLQVNIDCDDGDQGVWRVARDLAAITDTTEVPVTTQVWRAAESAGLILFLGGQRRLAGPHARFLFHGNLYRYPGWGVTDEERAAWFAERTGEPLDWWMAMAQADEFLRFNVRDALDWGVATEAAE